MKHLNEATIQAYLDGELPDEAAVARHLGFCERCANALVAAEAEQAEVNFAFASEAASSPIPSQRIWARIENEIDFLGAPSRHPAEVETKSLWQQVTAFFTASQAAFAGGLAAVVLGSFFAVKVLRQTAPDQSEVAAGGSLKSESAHIEPESTVTITSTAPIKKSTLTQASAKVSPRRTVKTAYDQKANKPIIQNPKSKIQNPKSLEVLPEERGYLNSIAELSKAVETGDDAVMRPSFRVDYERNLAVMNGAISTMQQQVRRNPRDDNAKRILFASYQNKIELLNTVAEKSQMIASLR